MATYTDTAANAALAGLTAVVNGGKIAGYSAADVKLWEAQLANPAFLTPASRQTAADAIAAVFATGGTPAVACTYAILTASDGTTERIRVTCGGTAMIMSRSGNTLTLNDASQLSVDQAVSGFVDGAGALPTGMAAGTTYYVKTKSGNDITLSASVGGATLALSGDGSGTRRIKAALTELALSSVDGSVTTGNQVTISSLVITFAG